MAIDDDLLDIEIPRDHEGTFDPVLIVKGERCFTGFDDKIIAMYARGMSVREIQGFLLEMYGIEVSPDFISTVTEAVIDEVREWQQRPLEPMYPVMFFDALRVKIRDEGVVRNKAIYLALGVRRARYRRRARPLDRANRGRQVLAAGGQRPETAWRAGHPDCRSRRPEGFPGGDQLRVPGNDSPDLHRASDPELAGLSGPAPGTIGKAR
ncbi:transposase [Burkholderia diffusa]|nr:transposase [Burkholderia diffusa]